MYISVIVLMHYIKSNPEEKKIDILQNLLNSLSTVICVLGQSELKFD